MSTERLERLDDEEHILGIRIVGGDHRLKNYSSFVTVHPEITEGRPGTLVIESFVVDMPDGNTNDETCYFVRPSSTATSNLWQTSLREWPSGVDPLFKFELAWQQDF